MAISQQSVKIFPEVLRSIAASTFTGSYQVVGGVLLYPSRIIKFTNNTAVDVTVSWDGTNDHEYIPSGSFLLLDVTANREISNIFGIAKGTQFYAKGSASTGSLYISSYYAS